MDESVAPLTTVKTTRPNKLLNFLTLPYLAIVVAASALIALLFSGIYTRAIHSSVQLPYLSTTVLPKLKSHFPPLTQDQFETDGYPYLLFFLHIPKTAGTTFRHYLADELCKPLDLSQFKCCQLGGSMGWPEGVETNIFDAETNKLKCSVGDKETGIRRLRVLQSQIKNKPVFGLSFLRDPYAATLSALSHDVWTKRITGESLPGKLKRYLDGSCNAWNTTSDISASDCNAYPFTGYDMRNRVSKFLLDGKRNDFDVPSTTDATVEDVKHIIEHELFFVGIAEYYEESLCLLEYQLDIFDPSKCNRTCDDAALGGSRKTSMRGNVVHDNAALRYPSVRRLRFGLEDLKAIQQLSLQDAQVYAHGLNLFMSRIKVVEQEHGVTIVCPAASGFY